MGHFSFSFLFLFAAFCWLILLKKTEGLVKVEQTFGKVHTNCRALFSSKLNSVTKMCGNYKCVIAIMIEKGFKHEPCF